MARRIGLDAAIVRFLVVGAIGFVIDAGGTCALIVAGIHPVVARIPAISAAIAATYLLNRRHTYRVPGARSLREFTRYLMVALTSAVLNVWLYAALVRAGVDPLVAIALSTVALLVFSFLAYRWFAFKTPAPLRTGHLEANAMRVVVLLLLLGSLLTGLGHVFLVPPWENFDETAHFSYVEQLARTGHWPKVGDRLSRDVEAYAAVSPSPYASTAPFGATGDFSYRTFFERPAAEVLAGSVASTRPRNGSGPWVPGSIPNWEAQHPPAYYLVMAPIYAMTEDWSLVNQLAALRALSYLIAWAGLVLSCLAARQGLVSMGATGPPAPPAFRHALFLAPALWPFLVPGWIPEMARLGNDALLVPIAALNWLFLLRALRSRALVDFLAVAALCSLGLLTKATYLPVVAVSLGALVYSAIRDLPDRRSAARQGLRVLVVVAVIALLAGWWFVGKQTSSGNALGSVDVQKLSHSPSIADAMRSPGFAGLFIHGVAAIVASFLWSGTWSFFKPSPAWLVPIGLAVVLVAASISDAIRTRRYAPNPEIAVATLLLFFGALCAHLVVFITVYGTAGTPGWYLHSVAPMGSVLVAIALVRLPAPWRSRAAAAICCYGIVFIANAEALLARTYAGCVVKSGRTGALDDVCTIGGTRVMERLAFIALPWQAVAAFTAAVVIVSCAVFLLLRGHATASERRDGRSGLRTEASTASG